MKPSAAILSTVILALVIMTMASLLVIPEAMASESDWLELHPATSPTARYGHTMATVGLDVFLFGGRSSPGVEHNDLWKWDRGQQAWVEVTVQNPPPVRFQHGAASVLGKLYIGYGLGPSGPLGDLWEYDPATNTWTELVIPGPEAHHLGGMAALGDDRIFVAGGYSDTAGTEPVINVWILDPATGKSEGGTHINSLREGRVGFTAGALGDRPMIFGGYTLSVKNGVPDKNGGSYSNDILIWNPEPEPWGEWETFTPTGEMPLARMSAATVQLLQKPDKSSDWGSDVIILGGDGGGKGLGKAGTTSTQRYNVVENTWEYGEDMPVSLVGTAAAVLPPAAGAGVMRLEILMFGGHPDPLQDPVVPPVDSTYLYVSEVEVDFGSSDYIPASAHGAGVGGTMWMTDLQIHNRGDAAVDVTLALLEANQDNSDPDAVTLNVPAGQSQRITDVLDSQFAFSGTAALRLDYDGELLISSRTYTPNPDAEVGGSYGQFIPAESYTNAVANGQEARLIQLTRSAATDSGFRTNIGFVNVTEISIDIEVELYDSLGTNLGQLDYTLSPFGYRQVTDIFDSVEAGEVTDGYAVVTTSTVDGAFLPWASVVDNLTGDPTYIRPEQALGTDQLAFVAAAAHVTGVADSRWRSDLQLHNPGDEAATGTVGLLEADEDNTAWTQQPFTIAVDHSERWLDLLESSFSFDGTGALVIDVTTGSLMATSRTFNDLGDAGTYGQFIAARAAGDSAQPGEELYLIQLTSTTTKDNGLRTNIGFVNTSDIEIVAEVDLYLADGTMLGTLRRTLSPWGYEQITDAYSKLPVTANVDDGYAIVRTTTEGGQLLTYASVVDNATNDPIFIPGVE